MAPVSDSEYHPYGPELIEADPPAPQPARITIPLKPHQRVGLMKAIRMEMDGAISYHVDHPIRYIPSAYKPVLRGRFQVSTNIGILGDIVGYGKTAIALSIIASVGVDDIKQDKKRLIGCYGTQSGYFNAVMPLEDDARLDGDDPIIPTTLVVVPKGPVYMQWKSMIETQTTLKAMCIDNIHTIRHKLPGPAATTQQLCDFFREYDMVLIKSTTLKTLMDYYDVPYRDNPVVGWARIMVDECHDELIRIPLFRYRFLWLISSTYILLERFSGSYSRNLSNTVRSCLTREKMLYMVVKSQADFVKQSFDLPPLTERYYMCKLSHAMAAIQPFMLPHVQEMMNANDFRGVVRELGGKNETEADLVALLTRDLIRGIDNKDKEIALVQSLDIPEESRTARLNTLAEEKKRIQTKLDGLRERVSQLENQTCSICLDVLEQPVMVGCTHVFCGTCLMNCIRMRRANASVPVVCPTCRTPIQTDKLVAIVKDDEQVADANSAPQEDDSALDLMGRWTKEQLLVRLIKRKPGGRFLVFSKLDASFYNVGAELRNAGIPYALMKGHTSEMMKTLGHFKNGDIPVILLNTHYAGSGIDISCATDVVILHSMGLDKTQAVGRAQRVGRTEPLTVHNLCFAHEMGIGGGAGAGVGAAEAGVGGAAVAP